MTLNAKQITHKLKEKWLRRIEKAQAEKKYIECGKKTITCKCPRCESKHESYIQWTGRGIPRIYCSNCRPLVDCVGELTLDSCYGASPTRIRRLRHLAQE